MGSGLSEWKSTWTVLEVISLHYFVPIPVVPTVIPQVARVAFAFVTFIYEGNWIVIRGDSDNGCLIFIENV